MKVMVNYYVDLEMLLNWDLVLDFGLIGISNVMDEFIIVNMWIDCSFDFDVM